MILTFFLQKGLALKPLFNQKAVDLETFKFINASVVAIYEGVMKTPPIFKGFTYKLYPSYNILIHSKINYINKIQMWLQILFPDSTIDYSIYKGIGVYWN